MSKEQQLAQQKMEEIKQMLNLRILVTALQGSDVQQALKIATAKDLLDHGFDDNTLSIAVEVSIELERLIRAGNPLSKAVNHMRRTGWLKRIDQWEADSDEE